MERQQSFASLSWLDGNAPATIFPTLYSHSRRKNRIVANVMENNNWITDLMHSLSPSIIAEYTLLWELVEAPVSVVKIKTRTKSHGQEQVMVYTQQGQPILCSLTAA
jgi:hypothetical protein